MGGSSSNNVNAEEDLKINEQQWRQIGTYGENTKILESIHSKKHAEQRLLQMDPRSQFQKQIQIYHDRWSQQKSSLVTCYGVERLQKNRIVCGYNQPLRVITERIFRRWSQMPQLTLKQCIYALDEALNGYKECYQRIGFFDVTQEMIGVTPEGEVKVWLNQNFALNRPVFLRPSLQTASSTESRGVDQEQQMVRDVVEIIEERCEHGKFPPDLRQRLLASECFSQAKMEIQGYIQVPSRIYPDNYCVMDKNSQQKHQTNQPSRLVLQPPYPNSGQTYPVNSVNPQADKPPQTEPQNKQPALPFSEKDEWRHKYFHSVADPAQQNKQSRSVVEEKEKSRQQHVEKSNQ